MRIAFAFLVIAALAASTLAYTTVGNKVIDPNGKPVLLRGICRPSTEWSATGENLSLNDWTAMKNWGANVIRIPLNQCFWAAGGDYQSLIDIQINQIRGLGMGVILDLHWSDKGTGANCGQQNMADNNSLNFWSSVSAKYKNNPWIIFELYNEPHDVSWSVWKNGGDGGGFTTPGFQKLLDTVRQVALNTVIINGLNWAYDLSGVPSNLISGVNIIYGTHPYNYGGKQPSDWQSGFGFLSSTYPVIATEYGTMDCSTGYYDSFISYANDHDMSWTAWSWYPGGCAFPALINDWGYTPTAPGQTIKNALTYGPKVPSGSANVTTTKAPATTTTTTTKAPATTTTTASTKAPATTTTTTTASTKAPTTTSGTSTTPKATTASTTVSSSTSKITAIVNSGTGQYWIHVDSFSGATKTITGCAFKDSQSGAGWVAGTTETWGPGWTWSPNRVIVTPLSLRVTASDGTTVDLTNVITSTNGGGSYLSSAGF